MAILKQIKDRYSKIYENEILTLSDKELRVLAYLRIKGGENSILWYSKNTLKDTLKIGRDSLNTALNNLEKIGALIIFNAQDEKSKKQATNVYYLTEYDEINRTYITANTITEIMNYALDIRHVKEIEFALNNNINPRTLILEPRLSENERKIKYIRKISENNIKTELNPCTENQYTDPTTENQYTDPTTENQYTINNYNNIPSYNNINTNNNNEYNIDNTVVVVGEILKKLFEINFNTNDLKSIINDLTNVEGEFSLAVLEMRLNAVINYSKKNKIDNIVAIIRKSIKNKWYVSNFDNIKTQSKNIRFNDFEQRDYDYDDLEKKLLGW